VVTIIVGAIGSVELATHTVNASVSFMTFHLGVGFMVAICTRIGNILPVSVQKAKSICVWGSLFSYFVFAAVNLLVYTFDKAIISIFTNDPDVIAGCQQTWLDLFIFMLSINLFYVNSGIAVALGKQWILGVLTGLSMFGLGVPSIIYFAIIKGGGIESVWFWMWPPYVLLNIILTGIFLRADWEKISSFIRIREGMI
jgi:Na+-driven multidrug efflux pump